VAFHVHVLRNPAGQTYVGQTADLPRHLTQHNDPTCTLTRHTQRFSGPWARVHSEEFPTRSAAIRRERELRTGKGRESRDRILPRRG
jgi:putative endonuclease